MLRQRRQQLQLRHRQRIAGIGDPGTTPHSTAQAGDRFG